MCCTGLECEPILTLVSDVVPGVSAACSGINEMVWKSDMNADVLNFMRRDHVAQKCIFCCGQRFKTGLQAEVNTKQCLKK